MNNNLQIYYWNTSEEKEYSIDEIRKKLPTASIPDNVDLSGLGYEKLQSEPIPNYNPMTHGVHYHIERRVLLGIPFVVKVWEVHPLPQDEVDSNFADAAERVKQGITVKAQERLDNFARTKGYDGILSACTYANSTVPEFAADAMRCIALRDLYWATAYQIMQEVIAGQRPAPASFGDIEADLPALTWE